MTTIAAFPALGPARTARTAPAASRGARLSLTRRGRALRSLVILALLVGAVVVLVGMTGVPSAVAAWLQGPEYMSVTVQPGDTLWGYATAYAPDGIDPRDYVLEVQRANDLPSTQVTVGTQIDLPVDR